MSKKRQSVPILVACDESRIEIYPKIGYVIFNKNYRNSEGRDACICCDKNTKRIRPLMKRIESGSIYYTLDAELCIRKVSKKRIRRIKRKVRQMQKDSLNVFRYGERM